MIQDGTSGQHANVTKKRRAREQPYTSESIRFTQSKDGNTLYAIQLVWPDRGKVVITKLGTKADLLDREIKKVSLLGVDEDISWQLTDDGLEADTPGEKPNEHAYVWKIKLRQGTAFSPPAPCRWFQVWQLQAATRVRRRSDQSFSFALSLILRKWIALPSAVRRIGPAATSQSVARFTSRPLSVRVTVPPAAQMV